jgi:hypothetical protein
MDAVAFVDPATHACPALQLPLHVTTDTPGVAPNCPAAHVVHAPAPPSEYVPAGHMNAVAFVDPAAHANPPLQLPLHAADDRPGVAPNCPATQAAVQAAVVSPVIFPNRPAGQSTHTQAPDRLYRPDGHTAAVALTDPATQKYPALQFPLQLAFVRPCTPPYTPAGQFTHTPAPDRLYCPTPQIAAVALVDPAGQ